MDVTNITVVYDENNTILRYEVSVRGNDKNGTVFNANVTLGANDFSIDTLTTTLIEKISTLIK